MPDNTLPARPADHLWWQHGVVYQTARADLLDLETLGLLLKSKRGNAYEFYPQPDLQARIQALADQQL